MQEETHISLKPYNTFGIEVQADKLVHIQTLEQLKELIRSGAFTSGPFLILGGGSNVLFTKDVKGLVVRNELKGIEVLREDDSYVWVKAMGGEVWHEFVLWSIERNFGGIENLSLIPGTVGAAPMQNIGAYGVEIKDTFDSLEALDLKTGALKVFSQTDCKFGYRESIFKNEVKGSYFIASVTFKLHKHPVFNNSYGAIQQVLEQNGVKELSIKAISDAVIAIRSSKLPNPAVIGNAGSFFKNPEIDITHFNTLKEQYPSIVGYPTSPGKIKVAAGWLIEQCGWKGKRVGNTGSHKDQALVLVNYGGVKGEEVYQLAETIKKSVADKFGIHIQTEVNII
ncbi:MAG: UDP-N-acetylmuramate dehydrogenase [Bacteroidia bacterium]|nr:UDP-N-acetylmuramate dehydrogenase [Bacteroidia bacterium]